MTNDELIAAEQPQPEALGYATRLATSLWEKHYKAVSPHWRPLNDTLGVLTQIDNMTCRLVPPPPAAEPSEAELPPLPIGEAEVVWHEPDPVMPERPGKIIDASIAFFDAAPLGTHLYTAEQMRDYALRAAAAARNSK